jgi:hypothetical protein
MRALMGSKASVRPQLKHWLLRKKIGAPHTQLYACRVERIMDGAEGDKGML